MLAAGFDDVLPRERRSHPRPLPQILPQAPTMFAAAMPQAPTTVAARNTATVNDQANDGPLNVHRRPSANSPGKDRLLGVGCGLRRERVRTFAPVYCERALLAKSVASALLSTATERDALALDFRLDV
jgi:hypothetical protein